MTAAWKQKALNAGWIPPDSSCDYGTGTYEPSGFGIGWMWMCTCGDTRYHVGGVG